jgi:tetratricopeptide (TPR) repeat protein
MPQIDLEQERRKLDREITFFHFRRAKRIIVRALKEARHSKRWFYIYYFTAQSYILSEKFRSAIKYLNKALGLKPSDGCAYNDKALCFAELGFYQRALLCFNQGITQDRDCASLYHNKGWLLNFLGDYKNAILCFHKALELEENRPEALFSLADSHYHLKEYREARKYFRKAQEVIEGKSSFLRQEVGRRLKKIESAIRT